MAGGQVRESKGSAQAKGKGEKGEKGGKGDKASKQDGSSQIKASGGKNQDNKKAVVGKGKGKEEEPKARYYVKDGKNYSYKVPGAVAAVGSLQEAEQVKRMEEETIYGLGPGGNVPMGNGEECEEEESTSEEELEMIDNNRQRVETGGGRGAGAAGRGRGRSYDKHHQKDRATKKHFSSLGGGY